MQDKISKIDIIKKISIRIPFALFFSLCILILIPINFHLALPMEYTILSFFFSLSLYFFYSYKITELLLFITLSILSCFIGYVFWYIIFPIHFEYHDIYKGSGLLNVFNNWRFIPFFCLFFPFIYHKKNKTTLLIFIISFFALTSFTFLTPPERIEDWGMKCREKDLNKC